MVARIIQRIKLNRFRRDAFFWYRRMGLRETYHLIMNSYGGDTYE